MKAYKELMVDTMKEMGVGLREANRFADEIFSYEKRIAEVINNNYNSKYQTYIYHLEYSSSNLLSQFSFNKSITEFCFHCFKKYCKFCLIKPQA